MFTFKQEIVRFMTMIAVALLLCLFFWKQLMLAIQLILGGWVIAFLLEPLVESLKRHMKHEVAIVCAFVVVILVFAGMFFLLLPPIMMQIRDLLGAFPQTIRQLQVLLDQVNIWLAERNLFRLQWPSPDMAALSNGISTLMNGTIGLAGSVVDGITQFALMLMLSFYFLLDRERLLLQVELLIPSAARRLVLRMGASIKRELKIYLRGQMTIAIIVGVLSAIGFAMIGVPSYLVMGFVIGIFNVIPYFGLLLGGIPSVLMSVGLGFPTVLLTIAVLLIVQQLEGFIISPRIMSGVTGLSPPFVLIALTVGGSLGGVLGMFFALPCLLIAKICIRVWIGRNEVIEKCLEM